MDFIMDILTNKYQLFLLVFVRVSGIFVFSPIFSSQNVPNPLKIGFSFFLSILLTTTLNVNYLSSIETNYILLIIKELTIGIIIGYVSYAFFSAFYVLGQIVDMEIGFGMVNVIDPQNKVQVPVMGNFYYILALLVFLMINGHHVVIKALIESYEFVPIGSFYFSEGITYKLIEILAKTFSLGFRISSPIVVVMLLIDILLGVLSRTMPQMNVFVVGMPLKIIVGLLIVAVSIPVFYALTGKVFDEMMEDIYYILKSFVKG